jgi:putative ABC transport system substrate-binding protein
MKVDVLIAWQTPAVHAAKQATRDIPIAMTAGDPVGTGLIASLARPGGNVTGLSGTTAEMGGKTLEVIRELLPGAKRVAVLANATDLFTKPFLEQIEHASRLVRIEVLPVRVRGVEQYDAAFADFKRWRADAVIVQPSLPRDAAVRYAARHRLPSISAIRAFPEAGGLISYAANNVTMARELAGYVDKILKGAKPADMPVQQPTAFELVINLKTASALGIEVPRTLLMRADKLIE